MSVREVRARQNFGGNGRPSITVPSRPPDPNAEPRGALGRWTRKDDDAKKRGIRRENETAKVVAEHGYDIEQNPDFEGARNPDYRIEGSIFDNYAPGPGTDVRNIFRVAERKVRKGQTRRVSINLDDSDVTPDQIVDQFSRWPIHDLEEVIAVKGGRIYQIFPKSAS